MFVRKYARPNGAQIFKAIPPVMRRWSPHNARDEADVIMTCFDDDSPVQSSGERLGKDILRLCCNSFSENPEKKEILPRLP